MLEDNFHSIRRSTDAKGAQNLLPEICIDCVGSFVRM
jgi:hypothetical protein